MGHGAHGLTGMGIKKIPNSQCEPAKFPIRNAQFAMPNALPSRIPLRRPALPLNIHKRTADFLQFKLSS